MEEKCNKEIENDNFTGAEETGNFITKFVVVYLQNPTHTCDGDDFIVIITDADAPLEHRIKQLYHHAAQNPV